MSGEDYRECESAGIEGCRLENRIHFFEEGDYNRIKQLLWEKNSQASEDCLLGLYVWKKRYEMQLQEYEEGSLIYSKYLDRYWYPMPEEESISLLKRLLEEKKNLTLYRVTEQQKVRLEQELPGVFAFEEDTGSFDYLYEVEALAELRGKKLSKKRNHINNFLMTYDNWKVEPLSEDNIIFCRSFVEDWYMTKEQNGTEYGADSLQYEKEALLDVLEHFHELEAEGMILRIDGACSALTIGQRISEHTYDVVFEKAEEQVRGAYNIINREFIRYIRHLYPKVQYINRENDLDLPGLRKAKHSYMPVCLLKKYIAKTV